MKNEALQNKIMQIILIVFNLDSKNSLIADIDQITKSWDSLKQLSIIFALEEEFDIKLSNNEVETMIDFQSICNIIIKRINEK